MLVDKHVLLKLCSACGVGIPKCLTDKGGTQCIECENCGKVVRGAYDYSPVAEWNAKNKDSVISIPINEFTHTRGVDTIVDLIEYGNRRIAMLEKEARMEQKIDALRVAVERFKNDLKDVRDKNWIVSRDVPLTEVTMAQYDTAVTLSYGIQKLLERYIDELPVDFQTDLMDLMNGKDVETITKGD